VRARHHSLTCRLFPAYVLTWWPKTNPWPPATVFCHAATVSDSQAPARELAALLRDEQHGRRTKFLFFWGHQPFRNRNLGPSCLSQWWPSAFTVDTVRYPSAEHYMMAAKARLFQDEATAARIVDAAHPGAAKALGRQVTGFDEETWVRHRYAIVLRANLAKFQQDDRLRDYLHSTGDRVLVEASPLDRIWGVGLSATDERASRPSQWRGLNLLGFALMEVRARLSE
jgi:ribA/ribD-fused uncharacterized protein